MELLIFFLSISFISLTGYFLTYKILLFNHDDFKLSTSFFNGLFFILALTNICKLFGISFSASVVILLILLFIIFISQIYTFDLKQLKKFNSYNIIICFTGFILLNGIFWITNKEDLSAWSFIGSLHSVRYVWLIDYIQACNYYPTIGQNSSQSIIVAIIQEISKTSSSYLYLNLLLSTSILMLVLYQLQLIKYYCVKVNNISTVLILLFANTGLSFSHILAIDSGSQLSIVGYTDTILGIFSIFYLIRIVSLFKELDFNVLALIAIILIGLNTYAPQNIIILFIFSLFKYIFIKEHKYKYLILFLILIIIPLSSINGGMLTVYKYIEKINYEGLMVIGNSGQKLHIGFEIGSPFFVGDLNKWVQGWKVSSVKIIELISSKSYSLLFWELENFIINFIRIYTLGIVVLYLVINNIKKCVPLQDEFIFNLKLIIAGSLLLILFPISLINLNGFKWELSRFAIPYIYISTFMFAIILNNILLNYKLKVLILVIVIFGPLFSYNNYLYYNIKNLYKFNEYSVRNYNILIGKMKLLENFDTTKCFKN